MAVALLFWWQVDDGGLEVPPAAAQPGPTPAATRLALSFPFHGDTVSLAWSPDGQRLAFNSAWGYYPSGSGPEQGVWVYERDSESTRRLHTEQRYHPTWLGNERIATACSPYETCTEGIMLTDMSGTSTLALAVSAYHTAAASDDELIFYNGFQGYTGWNRLTLSSSARATEISGNCSWEPPPEMVQDQCLQQVGDLSIAVDASTGLWGRLGESDPFLIDGSPAFNYGSDAWDCSRSHSGPVQACLAPDGGQVAYVAQQSTGLELRVIALPSELELAASPPVGNSHAVALFERPEAPVAPDPFAASPLIVPAGSPMELVTRPTADFTSVYRAFDFFGDSPSVAWSPDGSRLALSAAYHYSNPGFATPQQLGLFLVNSSDSTVSQLTSETRYHPAWAGNDRIATSCPEFNDCTPGMTVFDLAAATVQQVMDSGIGHTAASTDGGVMYVDAYTAGWMERDLDANSSANVSSGACAWEPPPERHADQCVQEVGDVRVWAQAPTGMYMQIAGDQPVRIDPTPPYIFEVADGWGCSQQTHNGPVQPCLSPDGSKVAYVTRSATGLSLHLHEIPR